MRNPRITQYGDYATWISFPVMANYQVRLILTNDLQKSANSRLSQPPQNADAFCYHVKDEGRSYIFLGLDAEESTVAHECWHIVHRVLTYCGVQDMDDEIVAYHLDHIVEQVYRFKNAIKAPKSGTKKEVTSGQSNRRTGSKAANQTRNR